MRTLIDLWSLLFPVVLVASLLYIVVLLRRALAGQAALIRSTEALLALARRGTGRADEAPTLEKPPRSGSTRA